MLFWATNKPSSDFFIFLFFSTALCEDRQDRIFHGPTRALAQSVPNNHQHRQVFHIFHFYFCPLYLFFNISWINLCTRSDVPNNHQHRQVFYCFAVFICVCNILFFFIFNYYFLIIIFSFFTVSLCSFVSVIFHCKFCFKSPSGRGLLLIFHFFYIWFIASRARLKDYLGMLSWGHEQAFF